MLSGIKNAGRNLSARHCVDMSLFLAKTGISKANLLLNHCLILFCKPLCIIFIARKSHIAAVQICLNLSKLHSFKVLYTNLLTSGKLQSHLADVEEQPQELFDRLMKQRAECEGISENLKAAIEGLNNDMDKISGIIGSISREARELNGVVAKNESGVENISAKVQVTYSMVQKLNDLIVKNMETARNINEILSNFS